MFFLKVLVPLTFGAILGGSGKLMKVLWGKLEESRSLGWILEVMLRNIT